MSIRAPAAKVWMNPPAALVRISLGPQPGHHPDGQHHVPHGIAFIVVDSSLHNGNRLFSHIAQDKTPLVTADGGHGNPSISLYSTTASILTLSAKPPRPEPSTRAVWGSNPSFPEYTAHRSPHVPFPHPFSSPMQLLDGIYSTCLPGILSTLGNAEKTVIFCYTFRPAGAPVLICPAFTATARSAMKVSPSPAGAVGDDGLIPVLLGQLNGVQRLAECSDLVGA